MPRRARKGRSNRRRAARARPVGCVLTGVVSLVVVMTLAAVGWLLLVYPRQANAGRGQRVELHLSTDTDLDALARQLGRRRVVRWPRVWSIYARLRGAGKRLRRGRVVLTDDLPPEQVLRRVARDYGPSPVRVTVPEGFTRFDVARRLHRWGVCSREAFVRVTADPEVVQAHGLEAPSLEGYLFPATYELQQRSSARAVADEMVGTWRRRIEPLWREHGEQLRRLERELGWGPHEVVTLASIVEKEAAAREEQSVIAGVFVNRMRSPDFEPKRLQADPTAAYGCLVADGLGSCDGFDGRITREMLRDADNPYNTYRIEGLPPGPIANPGKRAILAVLEPAEHDYFYFVARGQGRHQFSESLEQHVEAVQRHQTADAE